MDREYRIYIPHSHQFVPVTREVYYDYYRPIWRIQKQAQKYGQCMCPRGKLWRCDGCCLDCPYHAAGNMSSLEYEQEIRGDVHEDQSANVEEMVTDSISLEQLLRRMEELFPGAGRIVELRMEGVTDRDIADRIGIPRSTFRSRFDRVKIACSLNMDKIRCVVERVTYRNEGNGYSVIKTRVKGYSDLVTVVGNLLDVNVGSVLLVTGEWKTDSKFGRQFTATEWEETLPATVFGIEKYLGSGLIKGIGPKFARKIVAQFAEQTLDIIEAEPSRLNEVPGIGGRRVEMIRTAWEAQKEIKNLMLFLQSHDVSTAHAARIYKAYGKEGVKVVTDNPYRLADDIWGIGFKTADTIAMKLGMEKEKFARCRSGLMYTLNKLSEEGHCFALREQLLSKGHELLEVDEALLSMTLDDPLRYAPT